jgi:general stress protein YciG
MQKKNMQKKRDIGAIWHDGCFRRGDTSYRQVSWHLHQEDTVAQKQQHEMTVREAGKKGGEAVKAKYGPKFYAKIGKMGGDAVSQERGKEFYSEIGKKGGNAVKKTHGSEFYSEIGKKGGNAVKRTHGTEYYSTIGRKGGSARSTDASASGAKSATSTRNAKR